MIDIIIVNFNSDEHLFRCVQSVLASTVSVTVFVVDNHSTDRSLPLLRYTFGKDPRVHILENKKNLGFARANNRALSLGTGDTVLFLNPDCTIRPDTVERMVAVMDSYPDVGMAGCLIRNPDGSEQEGCRRNTPTPLKSLINVLKLSKLFKKYPQIGINLAGQPLPDRPVPIEAISGAFMFVRRSAAEQVGPMDDGFFVHCEDLDWCLRFGVAGWKVLFVPDIEVIHAKGACSAQRPIRVEWHKHKGMIRFYRKHFRRRYPSGLMYLVAVAVWVRFVLSAAMIFLKRTIRKILV